MRTRKLLGFKDEDNMYGSFQKDEAKAILSNKLLL